MTASGLNEWRAELRRRLGPPPYPHERVIASLAQRGLLPPYGAPRHHGVLAGFPPPEPPEAGVDTDYLGLRTNEDMLPSYWRAPAAGRAIPPPAFDEEYFEWLAVLEAVDEAARAGADAFTMIEVGAGYARWAARGWAAAHRRGLAAHVGVVEAEPQHAAWAHQHLAFNNIPERDATFVEAAVDGEAGETVFLVEMPEGHAGNTARDWYGQAMSWHHVSTASATTRSYFGRELLEMPGGWLGVRVPVVTLSSILAAFGRVDLVDFDIQGAELAAIREAVGPLTRQARRLHIGTHSREIDAELPRILLAAGWHCLRAHRCLRWNLTRYGWISFNDGVQDWINPALAPEARG